MKNTKVYIGITLGLLIGSLSQAGELSSGDLSVTIREDNGAIDDAVFSGGNYFGQGTHVSNYGFQTGSDTGSFLLNTTDGAIGQAVTVTGGNVVSGTYAYGGAAVDFQRTYSLVAGLNTLKVNTTFQNNGSALTLSYFDTFDPDQGEAFGGDFSTFNDTYNLFGSAVGISSISAGGNQHAVLAGSDDSRVTVGAGGPFQINSGAALNTLFSSPVDGAGANEDLGLHIGMQTSLGAGESTSFTYYLSFGTTAATAESNYVSAVPEPATLAFVGIFGGGVLFVRRFFLI